MLARQPGLGLNRRAEKRAQMDIVWKGIIGGLMTAAIVWLSKRGNTLPGILPLFPTFALIALLVVGAQGRSRRLSASVSCGREDDPGLSRVPCGLPCRDRACRLPARGAGRARGMADRRARHVPRTALDLTTFAARRGASQHGCRVRACKALDFSRDAYEANPRQVLRPVLRQCLREDRSQCCTTGA